MTTARPPITCTIGRDEIPARIELVERLRRTLSSIDRAEHGLVLHFPNDPEVDAEIRRFAVDEARCCQFWSFAIDTTDDRLSLRWDGPREAKELVDGLLAYFQGDEPLTSVTGLL